MTDYALMNHLLYIGEADTVREMTEKALEEGLEVDDILQKGLIAGMSVVGEDFKHNRLYVPQVLIAARAMKAGMAILKPLLTASSESASRGTIVMGTVKGDLHDIGKNLVCMMAEGAGFTMINLGVDTSADDFLQAVKENNAGIVGMSALLTTTMPYMKVVIDELVKEGIRDQFIVLVGGAPLNDDFAEKIGADAYCRDAATAVETAKELVAKRAAAT